MNKKHIPPRPCEECGQPLKPRQMWMKQRFCSDKCRTEARKKVTGANTPNWKGGANRVWQHIQIGAPDECWEWQLSKNEWGYGVMKVSGRSHLSHRIAYQLTHGSIPNGLIVRHNCDNPACCNPNHLLLGTQLDNVDDRDSRGRTPKGEQRPNAKLTEIAVREIRQLYAQGGITGKELAERYGVCKRQIYLVINRKKWKHI